MTAVLRDQSKGQFTVIGLSGHLASLRLLSAKAPKDDIDASSSFSEPHMEAANAGLRPFRNNDHPHGDVLLNAAGFPTFGI